MDQLDVGARPAAGERHPQRVEDQVGAHVARELPAHHAPGEDVDDEGEEHEALPAAQVGEIGHPQGVRPAGGEVALNEIGAPVGPQVGDGGAPWLAATLGALDAVRAHQALDVVAADLLAGAAERLPHPPVTVGVVVGRVELLDARQQSLVLDHAI